MPKRCKYKIKKRQRKNANIKGKSSFKWLQIFIIINIIKTLRIVQQHRSHSHLLLVISKRIFDPPSYLGGEDLVQGVVLELVDGHHIAVPGETEGHLGGVFPT